MCCGCTIEKFLLPPLLARKRNRCDMYACASYWVAAKEEEEEANNAR